MADPPVERLTRVRPGTDPAETGPDSRTIRGTALRRVRRWRQLVRPIHQRGYVPAARGAGGPDAAGAGSEALYTPCVETLSPTIRERYSPDNICEDIDAALAALASRTVPKIDGYLLSPVSSIPSKVADLLQLGTRRSIDLAESTIRETNREQLNSSCVLARAVLETGCLMLYISLRVRRAVQDPTKADFDKLNTFMTNTLVGAGKKAKTFYFREGHVVTNILTIMEKLDKDLETPFLGFYEGLSEHAHPNAHGMALTYIETHQTCVTTYTNQKQSRADVSLRLAIGALASALQSADVANQYWDSDREAFILLQEKVIHDTGTWPKDTPYPVPR